MKEKDDVTRRGQYVRCRRIRRMVSCRMFTVGDETKMKL